MIELELNDVTEHLGKPWERAAIGPDSFDCWGLVRWCLDKAEIKYEIDVDYDFPNGINHEFSKSLSEWKEIAEPENNCIVYGYRGDVPVHIGFVIDSWVFHAIGEEGMKHDGYVALTKLRNFKRLYQRIRFYKWQR